MPMARINGVNLFYEETGKGPEAIVLVHGSWGDHHNWDGVVPSLAEPYRVVTYDRRGHSQSERPTGQGSIHEDVEDLEALVRHLGVAPAHIVGNSFGASIVLGLALKHPSTFRSLVVHEPPLVQLLADDPKTQPMLQEVGKRISAVASLLARGDAEGGAKQFVETVAFGPGAWDRLPAAGRQTFIANAATFLDEERDPDAFSLDLAGLARFQPPVLLTQGGTSPPFFPFILARIHDALPRAEFKVFDSAGHVPHLSHPAEYVQALTAFLGKNGQKRS